MKITAITTSKPVAAAFIPAAPGCAGLNRVAREDAGAGVEGDELIAATLTDRLSMSLRRLRRQAAGLSMVGLVSEHALPEPGSQALLEPVRKAEAGWNDQQGQQCRHDQAADHHRSHRRAPGGVARQRHG